MCRCRTILFCLLVFCLLGAGNLHAQDTAAAPKEPSTQEKAQALTALTEARNAIFPSRRGDEARQLFARIATLLAVAGDTAGAQEALALLPANAKDAVRQQIVTAQLHNGDVSAALESATAIPAENAKAAALLEVVQFQAKSQDFDNALRTAALIPAEHIESVQALIDLAAEQKAAKNDGEAAQLLRRAATAAASVTNSNAEEGECGLSLLAQVAKAQDRLGESAEAKKTLQFAQSRAPEADVGCQAAATRSLQNDAENKPAGLQSEMDQFRDSLDPSAASDAVASDPDEEQTAEDATGDAAATTGSSSAAVQVAARGLAFQTFMSTSGAVQMLQPAADQRPSLTREQAQSELDSLRTVKPLYQRARVAMSTSQLLQGNGKTDAAEEAIRIGLEAADTIQDETLRGTLLSSQAHNRAAAKNWEGARAAVGEITDDSQRTTALVDIAFSAADNGHAQLALSWAAAEPSPLSEAQVLVSVAEALLHQPRQQQTLFILR